MIVNLTDDKDPKEGHLRNFDWLVVSLCIILVMSIINVVMNFNIIPNLTIAILSFIAVIQSTEIASRYKELYLDYITLSTIKSDRYRDSKRWSDAYTTLD